MERLPHSPSLSKMGETPEYRADYRRKIKEWRDGTREQAMLSYRNSIEFPNIEKYIRYLEGAQWDNRRPRYKSRYVDNKMELIRRERLSLLTDSRPTIDVMTNVMAYDEPADVITNVIRAEWLRQNMGDSLVDLADIAMLHGVAFWRIGASSPGSMRVVPLGPDNVIPIQPSKTSLQDSAAVLYRNWKPISYFKKVFPISSQGIEDQAKYWESKPQDKYSRPAHVPEYTWSQMSPAFRKLVGVQTGDFSAYGSKMYGAVELEEYYVDDLSINESSKDVIVRDPFLPPDMHNWWYVVKPGQRLYPRKRLIIFGGDKLLYDGPSPFWHGMYPFVDLKLNPVPWSFYGLSTYRPLLPMQDAINEIPAGMLDMSKRVLNPTLITKSNVASEAALREYLSDMPGARLKVNPNVNIASDIGYGQVPVIPQYVIALLQGVIMPEFDKMSGIMDMSKLAGKNQIPAGDTIDQMRDTLQTPLRREERYLESFLQRCGTQAVSNVIQFYTAPQRLKMLGENGLSWEDFTYDPGKLYPGDASSMDKSRRESFWTLFSMTVKPGSLHSGAKDREKMEAVSLAARGLISRKELYRRLEIDPERADQILAELMEEAQAQVQLQSAARAPRSVAEQGGPSAPMPG